MKRKRFEDYQTVRFEPLFMSVYAESSFKKNHTDDFCCTICFEEGTLRIKKQAAIQKRGLLLIKR